jgi:hypothetical protein
LPSLGVLGFLKSNRVAKRAHTLLSGDRGAIAIFSGVFTLIAFRSRRGRDALRATLSDRITAQAVRMASFGLFILAGL